MKREACIAVMIFVAGCQVAAQLDDAGSLVEPADSDVDVPVDTPTETSAIDLTELCGVMPVTFEDWERCYRKRKCEWEVNCLPMNSYRDVQECIDMTDRIDDGRLAAEIRERQRVVEQGRALIDKAAFAQCLADTSGALCNTARFSVACASRFTGTIGDGGACYTNIECTSLGATCVSSCTDSCCPGTCQPKYELGQTCDLGDSCEPGRVCHHTCLSGDIGSTCASDRDCDSNAWCSAGTCRPDLPLGAECTRSLQCGGETSCIGLSINSSTPGHCLAISSPGDRCDYFCYGNLYCDASGTCRELPLPGQSCSGFVPCRGTDTVCHNGQCVLLGDIGADCSSLPCMPGLFCTSELGDSKPTCVAPQQKGEPCAAPGHCESYRCSGTTDQPGLCLSWPDTCSLNVP